MEEVEGANAGGTGAFLLFGARERKLGAGVDADWGVRAGGGSIVIMARDVKVGKEEEERRKRRKRRS